MKRHLFKLALFLILGAIVNVAVAWGCAIWSPVAKPIPMEDNEFASRINEPSFPPEPLELPNVHASVLHFGSRSNGFGFKLLNESWTIMLPGSQTWGHDFAIYSNRAGWPFLSLRCDAYHRRGNPLTWEEGIYAPLLFKPRPMWQLGVFIDPRPLPMDPLWPGFAINTIFYAAILWLLTLGPFTARRMIRRKRGHCIKCGYDLRNVDHNVCPECGVPTV